MAINNAQFLGEEKKQCEGCKPITGSHPSHRYIYAMRQSYLCVNQLLLAAIVNIITIGWSHLREVIKTIGYEYIIPLDKLLNI